MPPAIGQGAFGKEEEMNLNQFIGEQQLRCLREACKGEEGAFFRDKIAEVKATISSMPQTYETDGQGDDALATLHYFQGGSDWYIVERDAGDPDDEIPGQQCQAFGYACLNGDSENAELGYISIAELIRHNVELDLYYTPEPLKSIKNRIWKKGGNIEMENSELDTWLEEGICPADGCLDGCYVELDGYCPHGNPSIVLGMGLI
jgi:hypothetical protein